MFDLQDQIATVEQASRHASAVEWTAVLLVVALLIGSGVLYNVGFDGWRPKTKVIAAGTLFATLAIAPTPMQNYTAGLHRDVADACRTISRTAADREYAMPELVARANDACGYDAIQVGRTILEADARRQ